MEIPKTFDLLGSTVRVLMCDEDDMNDDDAGVWNSDANEILIRDDLIEDKAFHTFLHEFLHAALEACNRDDLSEDEAFVDILSGLFAQMVKTAK